MSLKQDRLHKLVKSLIPTRGAAKRKTVPKPAKNGLVYMWLFDEGVAGHQLSTIYNTTNYWKEEYKTNFHQDTFKGSFEYVKGVSGTAGKFDGFTTHIVRSYVKVPGLSSEFSFEGWIAPHSPSRRGRAGRQMAIVSQEKDSEQGFIFGIFNGRLGIQISIEGETEGEWVECTSDVEIPPRKWSHVAVTFHQSRGVKLYLNGKLVGSLATEGKMLDARRENLIIGMSQPKELQLRESGGKFPPIEKKRYHHMAFDGLMDELKLYGAELSASDIVDVYKEYAPEEEVPLSPRMLPLPPKIDNPRFGAVYGRMRYYDEYENTLRIGDCPDILVRFDLLPVHLMFVHTNTYIPMWLTENDKMISDQSAEINGKNGYYEVMMDRHNRYSHVRLIESSDARAVIHWRYALCDPFYDIARPHETTGWGDWADETFTVYPDGVAARQWVYYTSTFGEDYLQLQETILKHQPGETNDDNVELEALTLANMRGETHTYSWAEGLPPYLPKPEAANIQIVNTKSEYRPYIIFEPGSRIDKYIWELREDSGYRVSGCLTSGLPLISKGEARDSYVATALYGMTENPIADLLPLARSWIRPPELRLSNREFGSEGYDKFQRAYVLTSGNGAGSATLEFELAGSEDSPLVNPAIVVKNWGWSDATLAINDEGIQRGEGFRFGHRHTVEGSDLIVWILYHSTEPAKISLARTPAR